MELSPNGNSRYFWDGNWPLLYILRRYSATTVMYGIFYGILYFLGLLPRACVVLRCEYVHRTRKSPLSRKYSGEQNKRHVQITEANIRSQQATITSKSYSPRCQLFHHQTKAVEEPPSPLQTTVSYGIILSHGHKSTATSAKRQFNTSIPPLPPPLAQFSLCTELPLLCWLRWRRGEP